LKELYQIGNGPLPGSRHPISAELISWYKLNKRDLPWRHTKDPFRIWLSEVILQQTRIYQGLPYYKKFVSRFENVSQLAKAPEDEILRLWQGLGYYSRAKNLHKCAKFVTSHLNGEFPRTYDELIMLPGIGSYTAAAIASIAFKEKVPVIDGNVFRVLSRIFGIDRDIAQSSSRKVFVEKANSLMPDSDPGIFNQAMMELGALQCIPRNPICMECPVAEMCYAYSTKEQHIFPVNGKTLYKKDRFLNYLMFTSEGRTLMKKREKNDIWRGLYDFYVFESKSQMDQKSVWKKMTETVPSFIDKTSFISQSVDYKHILTHQRIFARFFKIELKDSTFARKLAAILSLCQFTKEEIEEIPKPRLIEKYLIDEENFLS